MCGSSASIIGAVLLQQHTAFSVVVLNEFFHLLSCTTITLTSLSYILKRSLYSPVLTWAVFPQHFHLEPALGSPGRCFAHVTS